MWIRATLHVSVARATSGGYDVVGFSSPKPVLVCFPNRALKEMSPMNRQQDLFSAMLVTAMLLAVLTLACGALAFGQSESAIYGFKGGSDGQWPASALVSDGEGNFYGTTGAFTDGTVFKLTPNGSRVWSKTVLYSFGQGGYAPYQPVGNLILDKAGNLYGATEYGGDQTWGSVFELSPAQDGTWTFNVIYSVGGSVGGRPMAGLVFDKAGNLYGTTSTEGEYDGGTVFQLTPSQGGGWTANVIHSFGRAADGSAPYASLIVGDKGNLYGTTTAGGTTNNGTVFRLDPPATQGGTWAEHVLYSFKGTPDGSLPRASLIFDQKGNLDGTTVNDGAFGGGTVFQLTRGQDGGWTESVIYSFGTTTEYDGDQPWGGLVFDGEGNLYGTTWYGGTCQGGVCGVVFKLAPPTAQGGTWTETVLYNFVNGKNGYQPMAGLAWGKFGVLYGTTRYGGDEGRVCGFNIGCGTVFKIKP
jgi:uncharacterized repeat protein (TIGR03803 family)